ncbi:Hypothetical protein PHPALM_5543 [Phytophthora palmivora]|uniref:Uncharacterized protein n=1 Tax=Phytophthora palmivora TaxID=4796 RepID=A0A2P4YH37_9STRA|nr:Hypothetical protein PHPALM_5543 [Phytophthora palmivora]
MPSLSTPKNVGRQKAPKQSNKPVSKTTRAVCKTPKSKYVHTTDQQFLAMVEWLENPSNYKIIVGEAPAGKSVVHGAGITKIDGFKRMAAYIHGAVKAKMCSTGIYDTGITEPWPALVCQSRWKSYFARYKSTRDKLKHQTGFGITAEMLAHGMTLEDMVEKACPYFYRLDALFGEQSNVEPSSHTVEPECEEGDNVWGRDVDVSIPDNEEASVNTDEEFTVQRDAVRRNRTYTSNRDYINTYKQDLNKSTNNVVFVISTPFTSVTWQPRHCAQRKSRHPKSEHTTKRRDFASIYTEAAEKRLQLSEKRLRQDFALKEKQLEQEDRYRQQDIQERERERLQRAADKRVEEKNRMALQLLLNGKSVEEVNAILAVFFPE